MVTVGLAEILTPLTAAAGLALGVERTLELLKNFMDQSKGVVDENNLIRRAERAVEQVKNPSAAATKPGAPASTAPGNATTGNPPAPGDTPTPATTTAGREMDGEATERHPAPRIVVRPVDAMAAVDVSLTLFLQLAAAGLGILFASYFDIRLFTTFLQVMVRDPAFLAALSASPAGLIKLNALDVMLSGLVIGGGSQPIHVLIRFLTERKISAPEDLGADVAAAEPVTGALKSGQFVAESAPAQPETWIWTDIDYTGGVRPASLQNAHRRSGAPNLIVYHHTAMSSKAPFQDVVDEFLVSKKWLTGYHCVIMPDGSIKPFCRWDRSGNHAQGLNDRSLGIAFHGNFHTLLNDRYSNADGRYGNQKPTEAQLRAGARVVALWVFLYRDIQLDFTHAILPHSVAMPNHTVCPGSNFPHDRFQALVRGYHHAWSSAPDAQKAINDFAQRPYVHV